MQKILIDACGWVAIIDSGMNIDSELSRVYGPAQMLLLDSVREELEALNQQRPRSKNLLLSLLDQKSQSVQPLTDDSAHPDDQIFELAVEHSLPVLTVDVELKRRFYEQGLPILEVSKTQRIELVEPL